MSTVAEKAGVKDTALITYYNKMYGEKDEAQAIAAIENKEASKAKTLIALEKLEKTEAERMIRILQAQEPVV